jgi:hypothetical protein
MKATPVLCIAIVFPDFDCFSAVQPIKLDVSDGPMAADHKRSLAEEPPIRTGTPDPYKPAK